jgi:hypothetical protein
VVLDKTWPQYGVRKFSTQVAKTEGGAIPVMSPSHFGFDSGEQQLVMLPVLSQERKGNQLDSHGT